MRLIRPAVAGIALVLLISLLGAIPASAGETPPSPIESARDWLVAQQEDDGGFEVADFPPFETPDAILAVATGAQTTDTWSTTEARAAVDTVTTVGGLSALDWADDFVDAGASAAIEAKFALLVALPLGLDPTAFDPRADGATDLTDGLGTIDPALFNSFLVGLITEAQLDRNVHQDDLQAVCEAQQSTGGWSFDADPTGSTSPDPDSSGFATMALAAAGVDLGGPVVGAAADFFEATQDQAGIPPTPPGGFFSFGQLDANATTLAVLGYSATGLDPSALTTDPTPFLLSEQVTEAGADFGRIRSPNDAFPPVNTFATSQTVQGLALLTGAPTWLPIAPSASGRQCLPAHAFTDVPASAWNDDALRWLAEFDVAAGFPGGGFQPLGVFNRAQASLWFDKFFPEVNGAPNGFPDIDPWFAAGADFVGDPDWPGGAIASGFPPNGEFRGTAPFNRGQAILWMWKAAGRPVVAEGHGFIDGAHWLDPALNWAKGHGIVSGFADNTFRPGDQINRGQGAYWFYNLAATPEAWGPAVTRPSTIVHTAPKP
jgi:hypothetical protein